MSFSSKTSTEKVNSFLTQLASNKFCFPFSFSDSVWSSKTHEVSLISGDIWLKNNKTRQISVFKGSHKFPVFARTFISQISGSFEDGSLFKVTPLNSEFKIQDAKSRTWFIKQDDESRITLGLFDLIRDNQGEASIMMLPGLYQKGVSLPKASNTTAVESMVSSFFLNPQTKPVFPISSKAKMQLHQMGDCSILSVTDNGKCNLLFSRVVGSSLLKLFSSKGLSIRGDGTIVSKVKLTSLPAFSPILSSAPTIQIHKKETLLSNLTGNPDCPCVPTAIITAHQDDNCPVNQVKREFEKLGVTYYMIAEGEDGILFEVIHPELAGAVILKALASHINNLGLKTTWVTDHSLSLKF